MIDASTAYKLSASSFAACADLPTHPESWRWRSDSSATGLPTVCVEMASFPYRRIARWLAEGDAASTTEAKGSAFEDVIVHSFCKVPGVGLLLRDQVNGAGSSEIDILLYNQQIPAGLPFLPLNLIFECKNWRAPVDSSTVETFAAKVRRCALDLGILVATSGVTGDAGQRTAANDIIQRAFYQDKVKLLVVTRAEIESFRTVSDVVRLMRAKFGRLIIGMASM